MWVVVVCESWWLCVGHCSCVWVVVVVGGSWRLCGGCVCELREVSIRNYHMSTTSDIQG